MGKLLSVLCAAGLLALSGCSFDENVPPEQRAKPLDPQHNTWEVWSDGYAHGWDEAVQFTCPTDGRTVEEVTGYGKDGWAATVKCAPE